MKNRFALYIVLALLGLQLGPQLAFISKAPPKLELDFGTDCHRAAISPDGSKVAGLLKTESGWTVGIADLHGGPGIAPVPVPDPPARVQTFAWHASSRWLAFGSRDQVQLFDTVEGSVSTLPTRPMVRQVLLRGDLLLARSDEQIAIWNVKTGKQVFHLAKSHLLHADLSADGQRLAIGCFGEGVRVVDTRSKKVLRHLAPSLTPAAVYFCHRDQWLATALRTGRSDGDQARLFETSSGRQLGPTLTSPNLRGMAISQDGSRMLLRSDGKVRVWEPATGQLIAQRSLNAGLIDALSPDGRSVATCAPQSSEILVWSPDDPDNETLLAHTQAPSQVSFVGNNRVEIAGDRYRLWWLR